MHNLTMRMTLIKVLNYVNKFKCMCAGWLVGETGENGWKHREVKMVGNDQKFSKPFPISYIFSRNWNRKL